MGSQFLWKLQKELKFPDHGVQRGKKVYIFNSKVMNRNKIKIKTIKYTFINQVGGNIIFYKYQIPDHLLLKILSHGTKDFLIKGKINDWEKICKKKKLFKSFEPKRKI